MEESIALPSAVGVEQSGPNKATFTIEPCYPGYGTTLGNAMRRVLLSSLAGAAATKVKIKGVDHEFSSIPNVQEDAVDIILNLKQLRVKIHEGDDGRLMLKSKGEGVVTAKDFDAPSNVEVANQELVVATLTDKSAELEMEIYVQKGRGYVPVETQERETTDIGMIAIDAIYTPIKTVNFRTEHVRVGQMTNYDRLTLEIVTDGTITPQAAFTMAAQTLVEHFAFFTQADLQPGAKTKKSSVKKSVEETPAPEAEATEKPAEESAGESIEEPTDKEATE